MNRTRHALLATIACGAVLSVSALAGCGERRAGPPRPESITPSTMREGSSAPVTIRGRDFFLGVRMDYQDGDRSHVHETFSARLGTSGLLEVAYVDSGTLTGRVPATLPPGTYDLTVTDPEGREGVLPAAFVVEPLPPCWIVTTGDDEQDGAESPVPPHAGAGLSLREAIVLANTTPDFQCVVFDPGVTEIHPQDPLPALSDPQGLSIDGGSVVAIHGDALDDGQDPGPMVSIGSPGNRIAGLTFGTVRDSGQGVALEIAQGASGNTIEDAWFVDNDRAVLVSGTANLLGPGNRFELGSIGITVRAAANRVEESVFDGMATTAVSLVAGGDGATVVRNVFANGGAGVSLSGVTGATIDHGTFHDNVAGIVVISNVTGIRARNDVFTNQGTFGIVGSDSSFAELDYALFWLNGDGDCSGCSVGAASLTADPLYTDAALGDYTPSVGSPAIDSGFDTGLDLNGSAPGLYGGTAPDRGALESGTNVGLERP